MNFKEIQCRRKVGEGRRGAHAHHNHSPDFGASLQKSRHFLMAHTSLPSSSKIWSLFLPYAPSAGRLPMEVESQGMCPNATSMCAGHRRTLPCTSKAKSCVNSEFAKDILENSVLHSPLQNDPFHLQNHQCKEKTLLVDTFFFWNCRRNIDIVQHFFLSKTYTSECL